MAWINKHASKTSLNFEIFGATLTSVFSNHPVTFYSVSERFWGNSASALDATVTVPLPRSLVSSWINLLSFWNSPSEKSPMLWVKCRFELKWFFRHRRWCSLVYCRKHIWSCIICVILLLWIENMFTLEQDQCWSWNQSNNGFVAILRLVAKHYRKSENCVLWALLVSFWTMSKLLSEYLWFLNVTGVFQPLFYVVGCAGAGVSHYISLVHVTATC